MNKYSLPIDFAEPEAALDDDEVERTMIEFIAPEVTPGMLRVFYNHEASEPELVPSK